MILVDEIFKPTRHQSQLFKLLTTPVALLFLCLTTIRNWFFDLGVLRVHKLDQPVISVGNIAVGGTGKSPFVGFLAEWIVTHGGCPVIVSRGYRSGLSMGNVLVIRDGEIVAAKRDYGRVTPDEPMMLSHQLQGVPVVVGADRIKAAEFYLESNPAPSHWILDDAYQHRRLHRDLNILLMDATNPVGSGWVMPRGFLRENSWQIQRADLVVFTRANELCPSPAMVEKVMSVLKPGVSVLRMALDQQEPLLMAGEKGDFSNGVNLVCAIAHPDRLYASLADAGYYIRASIVKTDHSRFSSKEFLQICEPGLPVLTTEKDFYRDRELFESTGASIYILPISLKFLDRDRDMFSTLVKV